jgi:hypothetical protein
MLGRCPLLACLALIGASAFATPAPSQDVVVPCSLCEPEEAAEADRPAEPVRLQVEASLDFDRLILGEGGNGSAELGPDGSRVVSGSVTAISSRAMVGEVTIRGEPGRLVRIDLPSSAELFGFNGGSIRLESIRSDLPPMPRLDGNGRLSFRFGGVVRVTGDVDGEYRGDVRVEVEYF